MTPEERYLGCVLGGAVGDALGYPVEFMDAWEIRGQYGEEGLADLEGHLYSDDTQMTLAVARGLLDTQAGGQDALERVWGEFLAWHASQSDPANRRAPGNTCLAAIAGGVPGSPERPVNASRGCGGVMRAAPCALLPRWSGGAADLAARQAALTHGSPEGYLPAWLLARILERLLDGEDLERAADSSMLDLTDAWGDEARETLVHARRGWLGMEPETLGGGWTGEEALAMALAAALRHRDDPRAALLEAANVSGDSDSVASIAGSLLGCWLGIGALPEEWVLRVEDSAMLHATALRLLAARESDEKEMRG